MRAHEPRELAAALVADSRLPQLRHADVDRLAHALWEHARHGWRPRDVAAAVAEAVRRVLDDNVRAVIPFRPNDPVRWLMLMLERAEAVTEEPYRLAADRRAVEEARLRAVRQEDDRNRDVPRLSEVGLDMRATARQIASSAAARGRARMKAEQRAALRERERLLAEEALRRRAHVDRLDRWANR